MFVCSVFACLALFPFVLVVCVSREDVMTYVFITVSKASQSMKKYLRNMFNLDENQWHREFEAEDKSAPYQTFVLQILQNSNVSYVNVNAGYKTNNPVSIHE